MLGRGGYSSCGYLHGLVDPETGVVYDVQQWLVAADRRRRLVRRLLLSLSQQAV